MSFRKKTSAGNQQPAATYTIAAANTQARYKVDFAFVSRNTGGSNHVQLRFGSRIILSTESQGEAAAGAELYTDINEAITVVIGASTTGDYCVTWQQIAG